MEESTYHINAAFMLKLEKRHPPKGDSRKYDSSKGHFARVGPAEERENLEVPRLDRSPVKPTGQTKQAPRRDVEIGVGARHGGEDQERIEDMVHVRDIGLGGNGNEDGYFNLLLPTVVEMLQPCNSWENAVCSLNVKGYENACYGVCHANNDWDPGRGPSDSLSDQQL